MFGKLYDFVAAVENLFSRKAETDLTRWEKVGIKKNKATSWRVATEEFDSDLLSTLRTIQQKMGSKGKSRLIIAETGHMNAYYNSKSDSFTITQTAVKELSKDELDTLLGHEVGHQLQRNALLANHAGFMAVLLGVATGLTHLLTQNNSSKTVLPHGASFREKANHAADKLLASPLIVAGVFVSFYKIFDKLLETPYNYAKRLFEKDADKKAVIYVQKPQAQIDKLYKMKDHVDKYYDEWDKKHDKPIAPTDKDKQDIRLPKPSERRKEPTKLKKFYKELNTTHPDYTERERLIRETASEYNIKM